VIKSAIIGAVLGLASVAAQAQVQPLRVIVPFSPGTNNDTVARALAPVLGQIMDRAVVVDNRPGADGQLGADLATKAPPTGQTTLLISASHAIGHSLYAGRQHDLLRDFAPVSYIGSVSWFIAVNPQQPVLTISDLVQASRNRPGRVTIGSSGAGTGLWVDLFGYATQTTVVKVPYTSQPQVAAATITGDIAAAVLSSQNAIAHIAAGRLRGLATTGQDRSPQLPQVPTVVEAGWPELAASSWYGLVVPAATPTGSVARLHQATQLALGTAAVQQRLASMEVEIKQSTPAQFARLIASEVERWAQVIKRAGIRQL
jgi:tripartite-type tricarboxylate transporter receptor subunit TctC